ncbi:LysR family transcriptional regulator [Paraburkholderia terrae]|uniref:LysR family transcriptional regulator n=1 Tax=Paraburkholderia terrae TaxID=311230 RepID=UPI00296AEB7A|nr:LysR family transcriptional regulator [Paraburkholderia terrae]MDW3663884.1 LysR family transcriptional regulator [Paraburkholderia terrae]
MNQITDLNDLRLFAEVVEHGSFTSAARDLGVQTSKLSRRIRALEEELGVRLLNRTSRSLSLTETGRQFHQHCLALVAESKAAKDVVDRTRSEPQGTVRISCPVGLLNSGVAEIVARYVEENPHVHVLLDATNRRVDVVEEGLDFAIRVRVPPLVDTDLAVRQLGLSIQILVASPDLEARHPVPGSIEDLREWPTLSMANSSEKFVWNLLHADGQSMSWNHQPRLATDDLASLRMAALRGIGVAMLPRELVDADIQAGKLRHILPELASTPGLVHAIFPSRRGMVPAVRHLLDAFVAGFEELNGKWQSGI